MGNVIKRAWTLAAAGRVDDGLALLADAAPDASDPRAAKSFYQRALLLMQAARWQDAADLMSERLARCPDDPAGALLLGQALVNLGRWDDAAAALGQTLEREPKNLLALNYLALAHLGAGRDAEARAVWRRWGLHVNRSFLATFARVAERRLAAAQGAPPPVTREFVAALQLPAARLWAAWGRAPLVGRWLERRAAGRWARLGDQLLMMGNYQGALEVLELALAHAPDRTEARLGRVMALIGLERWSQARAEVLALLDGPAGGWRALELVALGFCLLKEGEPARALDVLRRCATPGPEDYGKHYIMGLCHLALNDEAAAQQAFRAAAETFFADTRDHWLDAAFFRIMREEFLERRT
ncbi:MAG: hypothetical protein Kow0059_04760 [Candidatus Sumerlaeia bacterium]